MAPKLAALPYFHLKITQIPNPGSGIAPKAPTTGLHAAYNG